MDLKVKIPMKGKVNAEGYIETADSADVVKELRRLADHIEATADDVIEKHERQYTDLHGLGAMWFLS